MAEEPKITYLFGAGASAQALPTIKGLPESILEIHDYVKYSYDYDDKVLTIGNCTFKLQDAKEMLLKLLFELYTTSSKYSTIDTYAKQLYLNRKFEAFEKLRFALSVYFSIKQKISIKDSRYETFLISLLESSINTFPKNVKFLSWNYDLQLEYAYAKISQTELVNGFLKFIEQQNLGKNEFMSIKINGSCTYRDEFQDHCSFVQNPLIIEDKSDDLDFILSYCYLNFQLRRTHAYAGAPNISYSWYCNKDKLSKWSDAFSDSNYLVVIGYSFPFFNREVDRKIIRGMNNLKKIYVQDIYPENIISRFLSILPDYKERGIDIIPVNNVDEFFLPPEL